MAESQATAQRAALLVAVGYEELPAVMSCEEAIEAGSFYNYANKLACGDVDAAFSSGACEQVRRHRLPLVFRVRCWIDLTF